MVSIIPPHANASMRFLSFTERAPDEIISVLPQESREATVLSVAVNGVHGRFAARNTCPCVWRSSKRSPNRRSGSKMRARRRPGSVVVVSGPVIKQLEFNHGAGSEDRPPGERQHRALRDSPAQYLRLSHIAGRWRQRQHRLLVQRSARGGRRLGRATSAGYVRRGTWALRRRECGHGAERRVHLAPSTAGCLGRAATCSSSSTSWDGPSRTGLTRE